MGLLVASFPIYADSAAKQLLDEKIAGLEVSQAGMCDDMQTTLAVYRSKDGKIAHEFVGFSGARYIVIQEAGDATTAKKHYFTKRDEDVVYNNNDPRAPLWYASLVFRRDGPNFFYYHFYPNGQSGRQSDCGLSAPMK